MGHMWALGRILLAGCGLSFLLAGCQPLARRPDAADWDNVPPRHAAALAPGGLHRTPVPVEKNMMALPDYVVEPPDILTIDAIKLVPKPPYRIDPLDQLQITVTGTRPDQPINGLYAVDAGGSINLGAPYGWVKVNAMTLEGASRAVEDSLRRTLSSPRVSMTLANSAGQQQITGEHLIGPDGTIGLGTYGKVFVTGMTIAQARQAIETHLSQYLNDPRIAVDVFAYNSKVYYVITEGGGFGDVVQSFPITGNETVLDALVKVNGISRVNSKNIWISRPAPDGVSAMKSCPELERHHQRRSHRDRL